MPVDATLLDGFDGQNFEIQNLTVNRPLENDVGFFKLANGCCQEIKNVRLAGGHITGQNRVGGLIGAPAALSITNCHSTATIDGNQDVGGLVGIAGAGTITGSSAGGAVTGTSDFVGGLVGRTGGTSISASHATGHVTGKKQVGGLIGVHVQGSGSALTSSWASGQVDGEDMVGGLIGNSSGKITFSFATGAVTATGVNPTLPGYAPAGGLIGSQANHATEDSYASGSVTGPLKGIGGLIGTNTGPIQRTATLAIQVVTGTAGAGFTGGLVGDNQGSISSSRAAGAVNVSGNGEAVGGLVGSHVGGTLAITASHATGHVTAPGAVRVGGLVGTHVSGAITFSHAQGNVSGFDEVGGLAGRSSTPAVTSSYATGTVSGHSFVGGLIGNKTAASVVDSCFATGSVTGTGDYTGGLIGFNTGFVTKTYAKTGAVTGQKWTGGLIGYSQQSIATSFAERNVSGAQYTGGLVGENAGTNMGDCYARGTVSGTDSVGGLVGRNDSTNTVARCYASGSVSASTSFGAFIGDNQRIGNSNNYWNATTGGATGIGTGDATGAAPLTSVQMKQQLSFSGFVFPNPWQIIEGMTEPYLIWAAAGVTNATTSLASSANPSASGQSVTFTATVSGNSPTGTVSFQDGANPLNGCIAVTLAAGQAQCTISSLALGSHGISAQYSGDLQNSGSVSPTLSQSVGPPSLDVDASITGSKYDAVTDGLLAIRYLQGLTGSALVAGALGPTATRTDPVAIKNYLDFIRPLLDIDGNGAEDAFTDGVLIVRYLFGLRGEALIANAIDLPLATRKTAPEIETYIQSLLPP
jgi:hypothetical protein